MAGYQPISAPFGTPEFYRQLGLQNAAVTGDPIWARMGTAAQTAPVTAAQTAQNMSVSDPGAWRGRVMAMTGQDPVAPNVQWASPTFNAMGRMPGYQQQMPQGNPQASMLQRYQQNKQRMPAGAQGMPQAMANALMQQRLQRRQQMVRQQQLPRPVTGSAQRW